MSCQNVQIPRIWVRKELSNDRRNWYIQKKFSPYISVIKKDDACSFFYRADHFKKFLGLLSSADGVRVYLATYPGEGSPNVPIGYGGLMTLIYAPVTHIPDTLLYIDRGDYYILNPGSDYHLLDMSAALGWVGNYQNLKLDIFSYYSQVKDGDTKSVLFDKDKVREITDELYCQEATGIRVYLASYLDHDPNVESELYRRTIVQFVFTETINGVQVDFYIEDRPGFDQRKKPVPALDTGSPCPPDNCTGASLNS